MKAFCKNNTTIPNPMTLKSKLASLTVAILCCSLLQAKTDSNNCPPTTDILHCTDLPIRHTFETNEDDYLLELCDLEPGETYQFFLNSLTDDPNDAGSLLITRSTEVGVEAYAGTEITLEAHASCVKLTVETGGSDQNVIRTLSVGCKSCPARGSETEKSLTSIVTDENYTPQQLVEDVFVSGNCFEVISNSISYTGEPESAGYFSNGTPSINIEDGVVLSSGMMNTIAGPNDWYNSGSSMYGLTADPDLSDLLTSGSSNLYDVTVLEFDFTPTTDMVSFDFVFASDEYCEYVGSTFNDVFGFFISGPGINGPFSNNAENIALVPNTNSYIAINTVNYLDNSNYYINNVPLSQYNDMPSSLDCDGQAQVQGAAIQFIEFDGFTTSLTAVTSLQACETYHIKLAIADVGDAYFDSAVFLKANSFNAGGAAIASVQTPDGNSSNTIYEACDNGGFLFTRADDDLSEPLIVNFNLSPLSTASSGVDFSALPTSITIPAGDSVYFLPVNVVSDFIAEGNETIILDLESSCSCEMPFVELQIADMDPLEVLLVGDTLCNSAIVTLAPDVSGGLTGYTYLWNTGETTPTISVSPTTTTEYELTVTDLCGNQNEASTQVVITQSPTALISGYAQLCTGNTTAALQIDFTGEGPWDIVYTINNTAPISINNITDNPYMVEATIPGTYLLSSVSTANCEGDVQGAGTVTAVELDLTITTETVNCPQWNDGSINVEVGGGFGPYNFDWDVAGLSGSNPGNLPVGDYAVTVTDVFGCTTEELITVEFDSGIPELEAGTDETLTCSTTSLNLNGTATSGNNYSYLWTTVDGNILAGANTLTPIIDAGGTYQLEVTNDLTGCVLSDQLAITYDTAAPIPVVNIVGPSSLDCISTATVLDGSNSQPVGVLDFEWTTLDGTITIGDETLPAAEVTAGGTYQLEITNENNGCSLNTSITIAQDVDLPQIDIITPMPLTCIEALVSIDASGSSAGATLLYSWATTNGNISSGDDTLLPEVDEPGLYTLTIFNTANNCEQSASVLVEEDVEPPIANAGAMPEMIDCNTPTVLLDGMASSDGPGFTYVWSTLDGNIVSGGNSMMPEVDAGGTYILLVTDTGNGCTANDEVNVAENPAMPYDLELEATPPLCHDGVGSIAATAVLGGEGPYLFSPDEGLNFYADTLFWGLTPGSYSLLVQDANGCEYEETITIPNVQEVQVVMDPLVELQLGESYQLEAMLGIPLTAIDTIIWTPTEYLSCTDCLDPFVAPWETTQFEITVIDHNGCTARDEVLVNVSKDRKVYIPNAFSPNGDGANDRFMIYAREFGIKSVKRFELYSRWGEKVFGANNFLPNDPDYGWDGRMGNEKMAPGVFVYYAEIEFIDGFTEIYKGDFTLMQQEWQWELPAIQ